jgi:hypothetical protein
MCHPSSTLLLQESRVLPSAVIKNTQPLVEKAISGYEGPEDRVYKEKPFCLGVKAKRLEQSITRNERPKLRLLDKNVHTWYYNKRAADAAAHLVNQKAFMCGHGVEATKVIDLFDIDYGFEDQKNVYLLTFPEIRGAVGACSDFQASSFLVGAPGIGKSWSLLYCLQQALLYDDAKVLLYADNSSSACVFQRKGNKMYAWSSCSSSRTAPDSFFARHDILILIDPKESTTSGARFFLHSSQLIFVMCAEAEHPLNAPMKQDPGGVFYVAPPSTEQLEAMAPLMFPEESLDEIRKRIRWVGPIQRDVRNNPSFKQCREQQTRAISDIAQNFDRLLRHFSWNGTKQGDYFFPERIFLPIGTPREDYNIMEGDATSFLEQRHIKDYEGGNIDYGTIMFTLVCQKVWNDTFHECRNNLLSYWMNCDKMDAITYGFLLQKIALHELSSSRAISLRRSQLTSDVRKSLIQGK